MNDKERDAFNKILFDALAEARKREMNPHAEMAKVLWEMYNAFTSVGFDNDEAFTLVVTILEMQFSAIRG